MTTFRPLFLLGAVGALSATAGSAVAAVDTSQWKCESCPFEKAGTSGTLDAGAGYVSDDSAKFGEYTGLNKKGAFLVAGGAARYRDEGGMYGSATASDLGLDVRSLAAEVGREGLYALRLGYAEIPRYLTDSARTPFLGGGSGVLSLPGGFPAATTGAMPLATTLQDTALEYKRSVLDLGGSWFAGENWTYRVGVRHDARDGTQRTAGSFFSSASQLVAPVDQVTDQLEVSASYASRKWQATLAYLGSVFRNGQEALTWANPFTPVVTGADRGQLALAPDNQFHQVMGSAGYEITPQVRASGEFAVGRMTQDAAYLAATLNTTDPGLAAAVLAVPAQSLQGRVDTFNASVRLTANPTDSLRVNASYARDVRDNRTDSLSYPAVSTDMFVGPTPRSNQPFGFKQDRFKLNAEYRGLANLRTSVGADQDNRERSLQDVVNTRETTLWGRIAGPVGANVSMEFKLAHAQRDNSVYGSATWVDPAQNPLMRKYNLAERKRDSAGLRADITAGEGVSIGINADYANDDYSASVIGLTEGRSIGFGGDVSAALSEQTQLRLFAQRQEVRSRQAGSQAFAQPDWSARVEDNVDVVGIGIKHDAIKGKLELGADLTFSRSRSDVAVDQGGAGSAFPTATTSLDSLKLFATYRLNDQLSVLGSYWYERYDAQDWHLDGVLPASVPNLLAFGEQAPRYTVNVVRVALRYRF